MNNDADKKIKFFKPEDFYYGRRMDTVPEYAARIANAKLEKLIESWPVDYSCNLHEGKACSMWSNDNHPKAHNTHKARLAFIESLVAEPCKHESKSFGYKNCEPMANCDLCGAELIADWKAK